MFVVIEYVCAIKRALRDQHDCEVIGGTESDPLIKAPDGRYTVILNGVTHTLDIIDERFDFKSFHNAAYTEDPATDHQILGDRVNQSQGKIRANACKVLNKVEQLSFPDEIDYRVPKAVRRVLANIIATVNDRAEHNEQKLKVLAAVVRDMAGHRHDIVHLLNDQFSLEAKAEYDAFNTFEQFIFDPMTGRVVLYDGDVEKFTSQVGPCGDVTFCDPE